MSTNPEEATKVILAGLPSRRMRHVIEKRFGLKGGGKHTLESIGGEYKITRERVRQIENEALKHLGKEDRQVAIREVTDELTSYLNSHGGVMAEYHLLAGLSAKRQHPYVLLLLNITPRFHFISETDEYHDRWTTDKEKSALVEKVLSGTVEELSKPGKTVSENELYALVAKQADTAYESASPEVLRAHLFISKLIRQNPYGEYGLATWPSVSPHGIRDKAHIVLTKAGKPLHFREVAGEISKVGWSKKKAHPQTVHNELIKDQRFILVGRGLYGLREWGYEPGLVKDVLMSIFKRAGRSLGRDEVIELMQEKRVVKPQTILLNLQNKTLFRRTDEGKYTLV